jgi:hypothetical protein
VSITPNPIYHGLTPLPDFLPLRFPSPTPTPLITCEDVKSAPRPHTPRSPTGTPSPCHAAPRYTALHQHKNTCMQAPTMNHRFLPMATDRGMVHLPRCAPTKPPDSLRADDFPPPTATICNSQETKGAQRLLSCIGLLLERRPTFLPPTQLRGRLPPSSPPPPLTRSSCFDEQSHATVHCIPS